MHIKFLRHGKGSMRKAVAYLLADVDHQGIERAAVETLRGNPQLVAEVGDGLDFVHRYTSGVVSWAPEERPTDAEIGLVLDDIEAAFTAGLDDPARVAWTGVLHREASGACHVHLLAARVDLETGKSLNVAPPGWERTYDALRDTWNWEKGWARPDDPLRTRLVQPGHHALVEASALRAGLAVEPDPKALITRYLVTQIEVGAVQNRVDLVVALEEAGLQVPRQGKDYLTVLDPETNKRYRLKGALYGADFTHETCRELGREAQSQDGVRSGRGGDVDQEQARSARGRFEQSLERLAEYNHHRYRKPPEETREAVGVDVDRQPLDGRGADLGDVGRSGPVREMGIAPGAVPGSAGTVHPDRAEKTSAGVPRDPEQREVVSGSPPDQLHPSGLYRSRPKRRRRKNPALEEQPDDRVRDALSESLGRLESACSGFGESLGDHDRELSGLVQEDKGFVGAIRGYGERAQSLDGAIGRYGQRSETLGSAVERLAGAVESIVRRTVERAAELARQAARGLGSGLGW